MKKEVKKIITYRCEVCGARYSLPSKALRCQKRPIEKQVFQIGDRVIGRELRTCVSGKSYRPRGIILEIKRPQLPDEEYENKWLGGKSDRKRSHVLVYIFQFRCPHCKQEHAMPFYAPELALV